MFFIEMGGCDIILVQNVEKIGSHNHGFPRIIHDFQEGKALLHSSKCLKVGSLEIVSSHCMENLLKKGHSCIIAQFHAIHVLEDTSLSIHYDL
jgi:hypothetical protein